MEEASQYNELSLLVTLGIVIMILLAVAFILLSTLSQRRILKEKMKAQAMQITHRETLLQSTILTQEEERRRIAKDLHDDLGSKLNVLRLNLNLFNKHSNQTAGFKEVMSDVKSLIDNTIGTTRRISHELLPPTLEDFGLSMALEELCEGFNKTGHVQIDFLQEGDGDRLAKVSDEVQVFRVVQELINNSIRHGKATQIMVKINQQKNALELEYTDNGNGFDTSRLEDKKGLGLKNIDSRLLMIGGKITYKSSIGNGVKAFIKVNTHSNE